MRQDNRGISLVEVMVVIAIIAVLGGVGIWGINALTGRPAQQCSQKIVYSLERHRTTATGKVSALYELCEKDSKIYVREWVSNGSNPIDTSAAPSSEIQIGAVGVTVEYTVGSDPTRNNIRDFPLRLSFDRSSGSFKPLAGGGYCKKIYVSSGGREYSVTLVPLTGKVYID